MAIGAVFFSLPMALLVALFGCVKQGLSTTDGLVVYAVIGTAILLSFTFLHGMRPDDLG